MTNLIYFVLAVIAVFALLPNCDKPPSTSGHMQYECRAISAETPTGMLYRKREDGVFTAVWDDIHSTWVSCVNQLNN